MIPVDETCRICGIVSLRGDGWCTNHRHGWIQEQRSRHPGEPGTAKCYWRGCRETECRDAHAAYERERYRRMWGALRPASSQRSTGEICHPDGEAPAAAATAPGHGPRQPRS